MGEQARRRGRSHPEMVGRGLRRGLLLAWLVVVAVSLCAEDGTATDAASTSAIGIGASASKPIFRESTKIPQPVAEGLQVVKSWQDANNALESNNDKMRKRLSMPWTSKSNKECCKYDKIPWFKFGYLGRKYKNKTRGDCETLCNQYLGCNSYSYSHKTHQCIWSAAKITYDPNFQFFSMKHDKNGKSLGTYHEFAGMKFMAEDDKKSNGKSLAECKYACTKAGSCNSFSWSEKTLDCALSGSAVAYGETWEYYEKDNSTAEQREKAQKKAREGRESGEEAHEESQDRDANETHVRPEGESGEEACESREEAG